MKVELEILSGKRQGDQLEFEGTRLEVGSTTDCQLCFSPRKHLGIEGRRAEMIADSHGWRIYNQGEGDWYVNQEIVHPLGVAPLRSGDIIRLSELGPDFRFTIVAQASSAELAAPPLSTDATTPKDAETETIAVDSDSAHGSVIVPLIVIGLIGFIATVAIVLALRT